MFFTTECVHLLDPEAPSWLNGTTHVLCLTVWTCTDTDPHMPCVTVCTIHFSIFPKGPTCAIQHSHSINGHGEKLLDDKIRGNSENSVVFSYLLMCPGHASVKRDAHRCLASSRVTQNSSLMLQLALPSSVTTQYASPPLYHVKARRWDSTG